MKYCLSELVNRGKTIGTEVKSSVKSINGLGDINEVKKNYLMKLRKRNFHFWIGAIHIVIESTRAFVEGLIGGNGVN